MKLDPNLLRYLTKVEWRVLEAVEMGMKNHELVPTTLIERIANLRRTGVRTVLGNLLKHKLLAHDGQAYDGYKLTYLGYDFLALRTFVARGHLVGVGMRMGVGKESDIHICEGADGRIVILKLHRLGRVSFRAVKRQRDYLGHRQSASWMYLARLAAAKEFAYMKALHEHDFPVPEPIDVNRHAILMEYIDAFPFSQVRELQHPKQVLETLMGLVVKMAECGLIHGDFNEFNLMISDEEKITMIDFPQIVSAHHPNADTYFARDVECVRSLFKSKFGLEVTKYPK
ncbi:serine/threonine-protein kinase rio2-like [Condylostylus longicornis]|uniref:serine/threonine-protein kinase rio2-like n=1 Tax=Condylostylus longicornis TaxID=2530218 RepID=UPI00244E3382|nr:serine/threonine-protein kinase rio2-like [Condylostylus longicornis]